MGMEKVIGNRVATVALKERLIFCGARAPDGKFGSLWGWEKLSVIV